MNPTPQQKAPVVIERTYRASLDDLWELWTTKAGFTSWWGPVGFRADVHEIDPREGGTLRYDMVADSSDAIAAMTQAGRPLSHPAKATFTDVSPKTKLCLRNIVDFIPGIAPYESTIKVELFASAGSILMRVTLSPMHDDQMTRMQEMGFTSQLTKLDQRFSLSKAPLGAMLAAHCP